MHIFAGKLVSRTSKQVSKNLGHYGNQGFTMILNEEEISERVAREWREVNDGH